MSSASLPGGVDVGVDVGGLDPGVLHPRHAAGQVVVGGRAAVPPTRTLRIALRHHACHQVDGAPLAQRAQHRAVLAVRNLAEHRVRGVGGDARPLAAQRVLHHTVW